MDSCPKELKPYESAYENKIKEIDAMMHAWIGSYGLSAVSVAVEHCLAGRKARSTYIERPILSNIQEKTEENAPLTEEEKRRQTEQLFMRLKIMGANHKRSNKTKDSTVS